MLSPAGMEGQTLTHSYKAFNPSSPRLAHISARHTSTGLSISSSVSFTRFWKSGMRSIAWSPALIQQDPFLFRRPKVDIYLWKAEKSVRNGTGSVLKE